MRAAGAPLPAEFTRFSAGQTEIVCARQLADALRDIVARGTVYDYAAHHRSARALVGRGTVYAVPLGGEHVVVRHNHHGGLLAPLTGDLFLAPTNAPRELQLSQQLLAHEVPTPVMLGYALYRAQLGFCRVDVITREVPRSFDLSTALMSPDVAHRTIAIAAAADLVLALSAVGAHHADLNVKNILLHPSAKSDAALDAMVLDLDRVTFDEPEIVLELNLARLLRSARKWQRKHGARVTQAELVELAESVRERRPPPLAESASS